MKRITFSLVLWAALAACASTSPRSLPPPLPAPDSGQSTMQAALQALQKARTEAEAADPNKGGHRERAIGLIQQAESAVTAGMQFAAAHPTEIGAAEGPAAAEPVDERIPGAE